MENAQHEHDCDDCAFLGIHGDYDLYFCETNPTVIARYGVDGDYISGLVFIPTMPILAEAAKRAVAAGLVTPERLQELINR